MKLQKLPVLTLIIACACATAVFAYQQNPYRLPNPFSGRSLPRAERQTPPPPDNSRPLDAKEMQERVIKLEAKVAQLESKIEEMQKPRMRPATGRER